MYITINIFNANDGINFHLLSLALKIKRKIKKKKLIFNFINEP